MSGRNLCSLRPGPSIGIFLGGLPANGNGQSVVLGAIVASRGIFLSETVLAYGTWGVWKVLRSKPYVKSGVDVPMQVLSA